MVPHFIKSSAVCLLCFNFSLVCCIFVCTHLLCNLRGSTLLVAMQLTMAPQINNTLLIFDPLITSLKSSRYLIQYAMHCAAFLVLATSSASANALTPQSNQVLLPNHSVLACGCFDSLENLLSYFNDQLKLLQSVPYLACFRYHYETRCL
jgi:hypothetical protein